jgi:hypothetical protein
MNKKAFIKKLWTIFRTEDTHDDIQEYAAIAEALMEHNSVRFEDHAREWFYETINTVAAANNFNDFLATALVALDFTHAMQHT